SIRWNIPVFSVFVALVSDIARLLGAAAFVSYVSAATSFAAETTRVVEFYNAAQDHYFVTADAQEMLDLDTGVHPGWQRTGLGFDAYPASAASGSAVCRFYIPPASGDSHFYSASTDECTQTRARFPAFVYESADVFHAALPDASSGVCPGTSVPVYRLW